MFITPGILTKGVSAWWKYAVKSGDTIIGAIQRTTGIDYVEYLSLRNEVLKRNPILRGNDNLIRVGWILWFPDGPVQECQAREKAEREQQIQEQIRHANEEKRCQVLQCRKRGETARKQREAARQRKRGEEARRRHDLVVNKQQKEQLEVQILERFRQLEVEILDDCNGLDLDIVEDPEAD